MLHLRYQPFNDSFELYVIPEDLPENAYLEPVARISGRQKDSLTQLMDDLWREGIRPTASRYHSDQVQALQDHLSDLREITRHILKMPRG